MKFEEIDLREEKNIVENCILEKEFVNQLGVFLKKEFFKNEIFGIFIDWILEYYNKYKIPLKKNCGDYFFKKIKDFSNDKYPEDIFVKTFKTLNLKKEIKNLDFELEKAIEYLKTQSLLNLSEQVKYLVEKKKYREAESLIAKYNRVEKRSGAGIDLLEDSEKILSGFLIDEEELFEFDGELGKLVGSFCRGDLVAYIGGSGRGKSWWLIYTALKALFSGLNVAFFSFEMTKNQVLKRFWKCLVKSMFMWEKRKFDKIPVFKKESAGGKYFIEGQVVEKDRKVEVNLEHIKKMQKMFKKFVRFGKLKIFTCPAYSTTIKQVEDELENMRHYEKTDIDVVVIDYADLTFIENNRQEYRHQLDLIWKGYRKLAQERNCLVVTATQVNRSALKSDELEETSIAEDIRKLTHVSKLIALNRVKVKGNEDLAVTKVKMLKQREQFLSSKSVIVLSDFDTGRVVKDCKHEDDIKLVLS